MPDPDEPLDDATGRLDAADQGTRRLAEGATGPLDEGTRRLADNATGLLFEAVPRPPLPTAPEPETPVAWPTVRRQRHWGLIAACLIVTAIALAILLLRYR